MYILKKILIFLVLFFLIIPISYAQNNNEIIEEQQKDFGIYDFINATKEYAGDFFDDENLNIQNIFNNSIQGQVDNASIGKKILNLFGKEFVNSLKSIVIILVIIVIHTILKSVSDSLENNEISKLIYYVQYILIVTIIMTNFSEVLKMVKNTVTDLVAFMNMLVPILITLMMYTGSIVTSSVIEPIILFMINFIGNILQNIIIPLVLVIASLIIISKLSDRVQIDRISKLLKSGVVWVLGTILTIFVGVVSLEGTLSSSVDGITAKTTKAIVSSAIPVVGKILSDSVDTVLGCGIVLKNAVGMVGVIVIIGIVIMPIIKLSTITIAYKVLTALVEPIAEKNITVLLEQISDVFKIFLAILFAISFMIIIRNSINS